MNLLFVVTVTFVITTTETKVQNKKRGLTDLFECNQLTHLLHFPAPLAYVLYSARLPLFNIQHGNIATESPLQSSIVKPVTIAVNQQTPSKLSAPAATVLAKVQTLKAQPIQQPAPSGQNLVNDSVSSINTQNVQESFQNVSSNLPKLSSPPINQTSVLPANSSQSNQTQQQNLNSGSQVNPLVGYVQKKPRVKYTNVEIFPSNRQYLGLQQGIYGALQLGLIEQNSHLEGYNLNGQNLYELKYADLNSGFNGFDYNANLLLYGTTSLYV